MKKIGIMGGTFNPIHNGHLEIAKAAYRQYGLEKVWFLPSKKPPHKKELKLASNEDRMKMVKLAIAPYPFFSLSCIEMEREGYSYTADTLTYFHNTFPSVQWYFIIGADSLHYINEWYRPEVIFNLSHILCAPRFPTTKEEDYEYRDFLLDQFAGQIDFIDMKPLPIASKEILKKYRNNSDISKDIPPEVLKYILDHNLYEK